MRLPAVPRLPAALLLAALLSACGGASSNGSADAGPDGGVADAGPDAGTPDAGHPTGTPDAGSPDAGVPPCGRAAQAHNAPYSLLSDLKVELGRATSADARRVVVDHFIEAVEAAGGAPLVSDARASSQRVAFFVRGSDAAGTTVAGEFNGWTPTGAALVRLWDTDLYVAEVVVPRTGPQPYKFVKNGTFDNESEDARAHNVTWDNINRNGVGRFNALVYPELQPAGQGRLTAWRRVHSAALNDDRDVFIYTPATYDSGDCAALPAIYMHDGNEALTRDSFALAADAYYASRPQDSAVLVFVALPTQDVRFSQYSFPWSPFPATDWPTPTGDKYATFLKTELVPKVDAAFHTSAKREDRGVAGISLGGLISVYVGFEASDTFSFVGTQSGSMFWPYTGTLGDVDKNDINAMVQRASTGPVVPLRFYVDHGAPSNNESDCRAADDWDDCQSNALFVDALQQRGYTYAHFVEVGGQHDWVYWKKRLPKLLCFFRNDKGVCGL